ncbi:MAG TPA: hypothetical protein PKE64_22325 [Anaerolineae bacterium]|nr:hypothetical protein [Anaerolineae bacterium]HMR66757.1 hypothetical protein [Anaerolineae bacterium]
MDWMIKLAVLWICFDIVVVSTSWYIKNIIEPRWPEWWERAIVGVEPCFEEVRYRQFN